MCDQVVGFPEISFLVSKLISTECCDVFVRNFFNELICLAGLAKILSGHVCECHKVTHGRLAWCAVLCGLFVMCFAVVNIICSLMLHKGKII